MKEMTPRQREAVVGFLQVVADRWAHGNYDSAEHLCRVLWDRAEKLTFVDHDEADR